MGNAIIKVDTGFVGGTHEEDTGLTMEEWNGLPNNEKDDWLRDVLNNHCQAYVVDEDSDDEGW